MSAQQPSRGRTCAVCGKPQDAHFKPFCSKRCADVDLGRWLKEGYAIPTRETADGGPSGGEEGDG